MRCPNSGSRSGFALLYSVFASFVVASMVAVMFTSASSTKKIAEVKVDTTRARYLAEGALSAVEKDVRNSLANFTSVMDSGEKLIDGEEVSYVVTAVGEESNFYEASGVQRIVQPYEVAASVRLDTAVGVANGIVNAEYTPLFQFAVFYGNDLEILPGPSMTLTGRVHSNGDMFLGCGGTLSFDSNHVQAAGSMHRRRKTGELAGGNVQFRRYVEDPTNSSEPVEFERMLSASQLGPDSVSGYDSMFDQGYDANGDGDLEDRDDYLPFEFGSQALWSQPDNYHTAGSTVRTGEHGVTRISTPDVRAISMWEESATDPGVRVKGYYHGQADLAIIVGQDGLTFTATNSAGDDLTGLIAEALNTSDIFDTRQAEGSSDRVPVLEIDVEVLGTLGLMPANGLLYAAHEGLGTGTDAKGILLKNGEELASPLTVVSEGSVYIQGDYNTVDKKGASVVGDAVNLLSNAWDNSKGYNQLPRATETTYNVAMVTGSYESVTGRYNGGLENLPRFHENWRNRRCNIHGSFVNSYDSIHATGDWGQRNSYSAPIRAFSYDSDFNSVANLPPFTPLAVSIESVVTW